MSHLFTIENLGTLFMLIALQLVLGFDNLLYISIESKRAPLERQSFVRKFGIGLAVVLRIGLLFVLVNLIKWANVELFSINLNDYIQCHFNLHGLIVLFGGIFIIYTALKEIWHMIGYEDINADIEKKTKSAGSVILWIVLMNLVFSFDSILSAMALTNVFAIMATAIVIGGILMIWLADRVSKFLEENKLYEVLGLFVLFIVGIMLLTEGGELSELIIMGNPIEKMSKTTFYFVIIILVLVDLVQSRYQKKLFAASNDKKN
ncbi:MAG: tellurium resistance protein TerC [Bacteroidia bacterium]|nr:tellurium resistance protein TerC [Bacteroidia bacterium]MDG2041406.1 tellurium resistance protein TerC [Bacteroidia bacterium]